ncbi:MAG: family 16 glycoside hydrolase [Planctomycetota bacterium]
MRTIYLYGQPRVVALRAGTQTCPYLVWIILFGLLGLITSRAVAEEGGFKPIFDGKTLNGWQTPDISYWSVQDGTITARATQQHPVTKNQFLVWQFGELDDFELKLKYRIRGTSSANSGIQIRSRVQEDGHAVGYQADIDLGGRYAGALYDEGGRRMLAERGQKTIIGPDDKMTSTSIADSDSLFASIKKDDWNDYHIIARDAHIVLKINGKVTAEVIDNDKRDRELSGVLALQLHSGPPMTVQFKDIGLKRLKMADRKKIVLVAGPGSHRYGSHEHNASCLLLANLLNENMPEVYAVVYTDGWPEDPTAFDNTDAIAIYCDGGSRHVVMSHLKEVDELVKNGVGLAFIHYAVTVPKGKGGNCLLDWIGGYYETYWSVNPHWEAEFKKLPKHPITRGVKDFSINDEWYYHMRFTENMQNVTPILTAIPPDSTRKRRDGAHSGNPHVRARMGMPEHVAWAYESATGGNGGRGFGFTGGHWHWSWAHDDFRKLVLNALVWITGAEVPPDGVLSKTPSVEELEANQDYPKPKNWNREKIQQDIEQWNRP